MERYICTNCTKGFDLKTKAKGLSCCPDCLGKVFLIDSSQNVFNKDSLTFTEKELEEITEDFKRHIEKFHEPKMLKDRVKSNKCYRSKNMV